MTHLRCAPLQTHHEASDTNGAENTTDVVDLPQDMASSILLSEARWVFVGKDDQKKTHKIPYANQDTVVSPTAGLSNQLSVEHGRAEWQYRKDDKADVLATVLDGNDFSGASKCNEFVEACTDS
jgi:hypothetical protein